MSHAAVPDIEIPEGSYRSALTNEDVQRFRYPVSWRLARDLGAIWLQVALGLGVYLWLPNPFTFAAAFVLVSGGQHGLMLATHEFSHYSVIPANRVWNDRIGRWLFGDPVGIPLDIFRHRHFIHHRTYSTDGDTKTTYRRDIRGARLGLELFRVLSGLDFLQHLLEASARDRRDAEAGRSGPSPADALKTLIPVQGAIFLLFSIVNPWLYLSLWLLPIVTLTNAFGKFRAIKEHRPLASDADASPGSGYYLETVGPFVRSVTASPWERLFLCKLNFGYHVEHHLWPQVSYQYLPVVRERLLGHGAFADPRYRLDATYTSALAKLWRST